jgi:DNA-binding beta-propeller fold protein YncE
MHSRWLNRHRSAPGPKAAVRLAVVCLVSSLVAGTETRRLGPSQMVAAPDGSLLYVACATAERLDTFDASSLRRLRFTALPGTPAGLALSPDARTVHVTCTGKHSEWCAVEAATGKVVRRATVGNSATAPVPSIDGNTVWVCCRFLDRLEEVRVADGHVLRRVSVGREPIAAALSADGKQLFVAHHLPEGAADSPPVAAGVSVVDTASGAVTHRLVLPNGATALRDIRLSPDGRQACVTHLIGRYYVPTTQLDRGWMNNNALSVIEVASAKVLGTVLLDSVDRGAANPWGLAWSADGRTLCVAHAGTHEVSLVDFPGLLARLADPGSATRPGAPPPSEDLALLVGLRRRVPLQGQGPRAIVTTGPRVLVAGYFSDTIESVDLAKGVAEAVVELGPKRALSTEEQGERWFNDASICFQGWQSCASCHGEEARVDGLNWDLLNDGIGNPKNTRSLLWAHRTPPAMSLGVRDTAETAVRAGLRGILFTTQPESVATAIDAWLKSLRPAPSPYLEQGKLSAAARRGRALFRSNRTGCTACHPPGLFTDQQPSDVGTAGPLDPLGQAFDTPTLVELWRTAPYLHDGSAATLRDVLTRHNPRDQHGRTSDLKPGEIDDLVQYLLSP